MGRPISEEEIRKLMDEINWGTLIAIGCKLAGLR